MPRCQELIAGQQLHSTAPCSMLPLPAGIALLAGRTAISSALGALPRSLLAACNSSSSSSLTSAPSSNEPWVDDQDRRSSGAACSTSSTSSMPMHALGSAAAGTWQAATQAVSTALHASGPASAACSSFLAALSLSRTFTTSLAVHERKAMRFPMPRRIRQAASKGVTSSPRTPATATTTTPTPVPLTPLEPISPLNISQQKKLVFQGKALTGDPGSPRWTAPYYVPPELQQGVPPVLLVDPWPTAGDGEARRRHAQLLLGFLKARLPQRLTAAQVFEQVGGWGVKEGGAEGRLF